MQWLSLLVPFAYLGILVSSLATFSSLYRKRKAAKSLSLAPYFPPHTQRNIYLSLLHLQDTDDKAAKVPDSLLRAALLARATEDILRILEIRMRKNALSTLLQRGVVGDDMWQRLLRAEAELEAEVKDVVQEANAFVPNWGQTIFQSANEMANNQLLKKKLAAISATVPAEKEWWESKRESVKEGLLRELDQENPTPAGKAPATVVPMAASTGNASDRKVSAAVKAGSSDEDAVLVDPPITASAGGGAKNKKKKGKK